MSQVVIIVQFWLTVVRITKFYFKKSVGKFQIDDCLLVFETESVKKQEKACIWRISMQILTCLIEIKIKYNVEKDSKNHGICYTE